MRSSLPREDSRSHYRSSSLDWERIRSEILTLKLWTIMLLPLSIITSSTSQLYTNKQPVLFAVKMLQDGWPFPAGTYYYVMPATKMMQPDLQEHAQFVDRTWWAGSLLKTDEHLINEKRNWLTYCLTTFNFDTRRFLSWALFHFVIRGQDHGRDF